MKLPTKWAIVIAGQLLAVLSSIFSAAVPSFKTIAAARAMHGTSTALYVTSILVLLVELSPKQHLALGIATLSAGKPADKHHVTEFDVSPVHTVHTNVLVVVRTHT
jgi:MFS family permease